MSIAAGSEGSDQMSEVLYPRLVRHLAQHVLWLVVGGATGSGLVSSGSGLVVLPAVFVVLVLVVAVGLLLPRSSDLLTHGSSGVLAGFFLGLGPTLVLSSLSSPSNCPAAAVGCQLSSGVPGLLFGIVSIAVGLGLLAVLVLDERMPEE